MGFYGKITNSSKAQFSFDKIYPNRVAADNNAETDEVYIGRYILIEYDRDPSEYNSGSSYSNTTEIEDDNIASVYISYVYDETKTDGTKIVAADLQYAPADNKDTRLDLTPVGNGKIYRVTSSNSNSKYTVTTYWKDEKVALKGGSSEVSLFIKVSETDSYFTANYNIDKEAYGDGRGYDSTAWTKVYVTDPDGEKRLHYIMIAELNSVVPTFDLTEDAPSQVPMIPHFDADSTNVYYKIHWQPQWGMRIKKSTPETGYSFNSDTGEVSSSIEIKNTDEYPSDETVIYTRDEYDKTNGNVRHYYYSKYDKWVEFEDGEDVNSLQDIIKLDAAIYYNKAGLDPKYNNYSSDVSDTVVDEIKFESTGQSGHNYNSHGETPDYAQDIQELRVMLPSVGDAIAKVWDMVYGDIEQNSTLDTDGSVLNNTEDVYVPINPTQAEFNKLVTKLNKLTPSEYTRIYYKPENRDTYVRLGKHPSFNEKFKYYLLKKQPTRNMNISWLDGDDNSEPEGLRLITKDVSGNGWTYNSEKVETIAGALNSVHDLMGMIISNKQDVDSDVIENSSNNEIYYYSGENKEITPIVDGVSYTNDLMLNRNDDGTVATGTYNGDSVVYQVRKGKYYRKNSGYVYEEVDTTNWKDSTDIEGNYELAGSDADGKLIDYDSSDLYYRVNGKNGTYYNYYSVEDLDGKTDDFEEDKYYLLNFPNNIEASNADLGGFYNAGEYWLKSKDGYYKRDDNSIVSDTSGNKNYVKLSSYTSGEIYTPGMYFYKDGDEWHTTWIPWKDLGNGSSSNEHPADFNSNYSYYSIDYSTLNTNYKTDEDGNLIPSTGYDISNKQVVNLIDYSKLLYKIEPEEYSFTKVNITSKDDIESYKNESIALYVDDNNNPFYVKDSNYEFIDGAKYYIASWDNSGTYATNIFNRKANENDYTSKKFFTYHYKPANILEKEYTINNNKVEEYGYSMYEKLIGEEVLYTVNKFTEVENLTESTYEPYTYFYNTGTKKNPNYMLDLSPEITDDRVYYSGDFTLVVDGDKYDSSKQYFIYGLVLASESEYKVNRKYYSFNKITPVSATDVFVSEEVNGTKNIVVFCFEDGNNRHYALSIDALTSLYANVDLSEEVRLYEKDKYYYKTELNNRVVYLRDDSEIGTAVSDTYTLDSNNYFDSSKIYYEYNKDDNIYSVVTIDSDDYSANKYYILEKDYSKYYIWDSNKDETLHVDADDFYEQGIYFYKDNETYFLDYGVNTSSNRIYYKSTPYYVIQDDLGLYSRGAQWNTGVVPVPKSIHIAKRHEFKKWVPLENFGRKLNTINGLILKLANILEVDNTLTRDTSTTQGCINSIKDIIAKFGGGEPGSIVITDGYGRYRGSTCYTLQDDLVTNYGKKDSATTSGYIEKEIPIDYKSDDSHLLGRWIDIDVQSYFFNGKGYKNYSDAKAAMEEKDITFGVLKSDKNNIRRYYYSWSDITEDEFKKYKNSLYTATTAGSGVLELSNLTAATGYVSGATYWQFIISEASDNIRTLPELYHLLLDSNSEMMITHNFNEQADTTTTSNKNNGEGDGLNASSEDTLKLYTPIVDATGHIVGKNEETVILPYGYKTIKVSNDNSTTSDAASTVNTGGQSANSAQDTLTFSASNKWIKLDNNSEDTIKIGHTVNLITTTAKSDTDLDNSQTFTIQDLTFDEAGHMTANQSHKYTLPDGFKTIAIGDSSTSTSNLTYNKGSIIADNQVDTLTIVPGNKWITLAADADNDKLTIGHIVSTIATNGNGTSVTNNNFGGTITIPDFAYDTAGHITSIGSHTVNIPKGSYTNTTADGTVGKATGVITGIGFTDSTGAITSTSNYLGSILLGSYTAPVGGNGISASSSLSGALSTLDARIYAEETARASAINGLDVSDISGFGKGKTLSALTETDGKISASFQDIEITSSQISDITNKYSSTGAVAITGAAVAEALGTLDGSTEGEAGAGNTLTSFSQTDGKVTAKFGAISITASQISDLTDTLNSVYEAADSTIVKSGTTFNYVPTGLSTAEDVTTETKTLQEIITALSDRIAALESAATTTTE